MTFKFKLQHHAQFTSDYLKHVLLENAQNICPSQKLAEAMAYAVLNGGKRFRPFLVMETAALFDAQSTQSVCVAAALEVIHCYSLVHDDLPAMDDDDLRRGRPTVHIAYDEATAILVGDALLTLAFEILNNPENGIGAETRSELSLLLARAAGWGGMVSGQALDLAAEEAETHTLDEIERIQQHKTGALLTFACEAGAILGGAAEDGRYALRTYGQLIGRAFQIADDLLDIQGDPQKLGKATAKDTRAGKATLVTLMGVEKAKRVLRDLEDEAVQSLALFGERAEVLMEAAYFVSRRES